MKVREEEAKKRYDAYTEYSGRKEYGKRWEFANDILYNMCEDNLGHNDKHVIVAKIWLIGRSYAAAIDRRKLKTNISTEKFYYDHVAESIWNIREDLDERIKALKENGKSIKDDLPMILGTHRLLTDTFEISSGEKNRSLASKYLHFHCRDKFFIYDSNAREAIGKLFEKPDKEDKKDKKQRLSDLKGDYDPEYADFVLRALDLQTDLGNKGIHLKNPREMDTFLLCEL